MFHEHDFLRGPLSYVDRRVTVTFYMGESAWFIVLAFIVITAVVIHEILTRRAVKRRGLSEIEDRPTDGQ
jgi:hypothetical protein